MPFANGFNGDYKMLPVIIKTMEAKNYFIDHVTANARLQVTAKGEMASFYTKGALTASEATELGGQLTPTSKGAKRIDVPLNAGGKIHFVIPGVNLETVTPDVVAAYVTEEVIHLMNLRQASGLTKLIAGAQAKEYTKDATAYAALLEGIKEFKVDNKLNHLRPTGILVSSAFWADLLQDNKYIRATDRADLKVFDGQVLEIAGIPIIEAVDMAANDFLVVNAEGVAAPINIHNFEVFPGAYMGYPGGVVGLGEIGYNFKVVTKSDDASLSSTGYFVAKFTEATQ